MPYFKTFSLFFIKGFMGNIVVDDWDNDCDTFRCLFVSDQCSLNHVGVESSHDLCSQVLIKALVSGQYLLRSDQVAIIKWWAVIRAISDNNAPQYSPPLNSTIISRLTPAQTLHSQHLIYCLILDISNLYQIVVFSSIIFIKNQRLPTWLI